VLRRLATRALARLGAEGVEVGVFLCDDLTIRTLNRRYRGRDRATDVLSFPGGFTLPDGPIYLGDVAISLETAARQALSAGIPFLQELQCLLLHALLHLLGFDHETDAGEMSSQENELRAELIR
jgi:probable rRNA maturation factor